MTGVGYAPPSLRTRKPPDTGARIVVRMDVTTRQAASVTGRCPATLRYLAAHGKIPGATKVGRDWVLPLDAVLALPNPRTRKASAA